MRCKCWCEVGTSRYCSMARVNLIFANEVKILFPFLDNDAEIHNKRRNVLLLFQSEDLF